MIPRTPEIKARSRRQLTEAFLSQGANSRSYGTDAQRIEDWSVLNIGDRVEIHSSADIPRPGTIDELSDDASLVWVWLDGRGRMLVSEYDEVEFWAPSTNF